MRGLGNGKGLCDQLLGRTTILRDREISASCNSIYLTVIGVAGNCPMQEVMVLFVFWDVGGSGNVPSSAKTNYIFF